MTHMQHIINNIEDQLCSTASGFCDKNNTHDARSSVMCGTVWGLGDRDRKRPDLVNLYGGGGSN